MEQRKLEDGRFLVKSQGVLVSVVNSCIASLGETKQSARVAFRDELGRDGQFVFTGNLPTDIIGHDFFLTETYASENLKKLLSQYLFDTETEKEYSFVAER